MNDSYLVLLTLVYREERGTRRMHGRTRGIKFAGRFYHTSAAKLSKNEKRE